MTSVIDRILTPEAVVFLVDLETEFGWRRGRLLAERHQRQLRIDGGELPDFLSADTGEETWRIGSVPAEIADRRVEITGPVERKMMINALNSGARVFMADFEDATTPTWGNVLEGQANIVDAYERTLSLETPERTYRIGDYPATLMVRPRGWHLEESHFEVEGHPMSASLFDFGLYMFHGAGAAIAAGSGPYVYLPKLENHHEARLWNEVLTWCEERLDIPRGTTKATVLIETILAAFEMEEILFELREHAAGLNAGRWDYIFSMIKKFRNHPGFVLGDRADVTMTVPFMTAYTRLLVATCHRRGAHAIGGMAAFIPNRRDPEVTAKALAAVKADKAREAALGFDGTWVAHPDLVEVAMAEFDAVLGERPNQIDRLDRLDGAEVTAADLLDVDFPSRITMAGVETNVEVGIRYLVSWLAGTGAVAIDNLMEDVATAEISRSQIWQWIHQGATTDEGFVVDEGLVRSIADRVTETMTAETVHTARKVFEDVALGDDFVEFLTLPAYELID
ncbi:MAG: malate synthase A [Actinobacteria bacterium]|nr:malate synthase A [Actinomycetota bacterium]